MSAALELIAAVGALKSPTPRRAASALRPAWLSSAISARAKRRSAALSARRRPGGAATRHRRAECGNLSEGTRRLIGKLFELKGLGPQDLKGIARRVRAFAALRPSSIESRFEALHGSGLTALVGREEEAELLMRRWAKAKSGEGQFVLLSGEAGIGKSRLTAALLEGVAAEPNTRLRYFPHRT